VAREGIVVERWEAVVVPRRPVVVVTRPRSFGLGAGARSRPVLGAAADPRPDELAKDPRPSGLGAEDAIA
jgi:hypothetical protein